MKIKLSLDVMLRLLAYAAATPDEFSGFGFCNRDGNDIFVYDFVLLNKGSYTFTEIPPAKILPLMDREDRANMKVWLHRHPMGNGIPGPHNWSGTDETTILREPLGSTPQAVNWSISIVLTPGGFVGRIDNYVKGIVQHLEVEPNVITWYQEMRELAAHSPFRQEVSSAGNTDEYEDENLQEELEAWQEESDLDRRQWEQWEPPTTTGEFTNVFEALRELVREFDPRGWSLADICEQYGLDWKTERQRTRNQLSLWR